MNSAICRDITATRQTLSPALTSGAQAPAARRFPHSTRRKPMQAAKHASSVNASALIYTCALADFAAINRDRFDIVAVCGNSLGWYLTLAAAGAVDEANAIRLVDTMGALMEEQGVGGQLIYPFVDEEWRDSRGRERAISNALHDGRTEGDAYLSIRLGGMAVLAGDEVGMAAMEKVLTPVEDRYPFRLARHSAFHTPLLQHVSDAAFAELDARNVQRAAGSDDRRPRRGLDASFNRTGGASSVYARISDRRNIRFFKVDRGRGQGILTRLPYPRRARFDIGRADRSGADPPSLAGANV